MYTIQEMTDNIKIVVYCNTKFNLLLSNTISTCIWKIKINSLCSFVGETDFSLVLMVCEFTEIDILSHLNEAEQVCRQIYK